MKEADGPSLQKLLDTAKGKPEEAAVSMMVLRSLMKARYDGENLGHFGLAAKYYCHFTSPIRRYPDLMVHRILTALLDGEAVRRDGRRLAAAVQKAAVQSSQRELATQSAEREIEKRYMAEFMAGHVGETLPEPYPASPASACLSCCPAGWRACWGWRPCPAGATTTTRPASR